MPIQTPPCDEEAAMSAQPADPQQDESDPSAFSHAKDQEPPTNKASMASETDNPSADNDLPPQSSMILQSILHRRKEGGINAR